MKKCILIIIGITLISLTSCKKDNCQTCTKTIGGFGGNITVKERVICNENVANNLEKSSSGTTVWDCK